MRQLFEILAIFDWVTPVVGLAETFAHDQTLLQTNSHTFFVNYDDLLRYGWNANEVQGLLREYGIDSWGSQITGNKFHFTVYAQQETAARELFLSKGIPIA